MKKHFLFAVVAIGALTLLFPFNAEAKSGVGKKHRTQRVDKDNNPPGAKGGPGTNWENPPGPKGGAGTSPDRKPLIKKVLEVKDGSVKHKPLLKGKKHIAYTENSSDYSEDAIQPKRKGKAIVDANWEKKADLNGDGIVDKFEFEKWKKRVKHKKGETSSKSKQTVNTRWEHKADANSDGVVDKTEVTQFRGTKNNNPPKAKVISNTNFARKQKVRHKK